MELRPPPRELPSSLVLALRLGGTLQQVGLWLLSFGLVFWWIFGAQADTSGYLFHIDGTRVLDGEVVSSRPTAWSEGSRSSGTRIYAVDYRYRTPDGRTHEDVSYAPGAHYPAGYRVRVEWVPGSEDLARIAGMRRAPLSPWATFVVLFPLVGLVLAGVGARRGKRAARLLREGAFSRGVLKEKRATGARINKRPVYALTFEFFAEDGSVHRVTSRTHRPETLEDEPTEALVYDPQDPDRAVTLDDLPAPVAVDLSGALRPVGTRRVVLALLPVVVLVLGNLAWLLLAAPF